MNAHNQRSDLMRPAPLPDAEEGRINDGNWRSQRGESYGAFRLRYKNADLCIISSGKGIPDHVHAEMRWEHVSVSLKNRCPNWEEMTWVKSLFWDDEETVIQYHPPKSQYKNVHNFCLHMWRPTDFEIQLPPIGAV